MSDLRQVDRVMLERLERIEKALLGIASGLWFGDQNGDAVACFDEVRQDLREPLLTEQPEQDECHICHGEPEKRTFCSRCQPAATQPECEDIQIPECDQIYSEWVSAEHAEGGEVADTEYALMGWTAAWYYLKPDLEAAEEKLARLEEALTPSEETKRAYWGSDSIRCLPWVDIKALMALIRERACLNELAAERPTPHSTEDGQ